MARTTIDINLDTHGTLDADRQVAVPSGGTTGESLVKASDADYDVEWATVSGGGGGTPAENAASLVTAYNLFR